MTPEAQRIAIAEACGWTWMRWGNPPDETNRFMAPPGRGAKGSMIQCERPTHGRPINLNDIPDYLNDLNAMHEAEKTLDFRDRRKFAEKLSAITETERGDHWDDALALCHATAKQRAEAFLRAKGLWV